MGRLSTMEHRTFLRGAAAIVSMPAIAAGREETHRFRTGEFDIEMAVEYHDAYSSSGFWFRQAGTPRRFCLSAAGEEDRECLAEFRGSLAIAKYRVRARSPGSTAPKLREYVRTVDRDGRLRDRAPLERTIELERGVGSDLQAFGYDAP